MLCVGAGRNQSGEAEERDEQVRFPSSIGQRSLGCLATIHHPKDRRPHAGEVAGPAAVRPAVHLRFAHDRDGVADEADLLVVQHVEGGVGARLGLAGPGVQEAFLSKVAPSGSAGASPHANTRFRASAATSS